MKRFQTLSIVFLILMLFLSGCATEPEQIKTEKITDNDPAATVLPAKTSLHNSPPKEWIWSTVPVNGHPVFFAVSGLRADRKEEKTYCLQSAAIQAAQFEKISGASELRMQKSNIHFGRLENSEVFYNYEQARYFYDRLEVLEEYTDEKGTYVLATLPDISLDIPFTPRYINGEPTWIASPPDIPGFITSVGVVKMHRTFPDSLAAADKAAFMELLNILFGYVEAESAERVTANSSSVSSQGYTTTGITAEGDIVNFYILARWRDKNLNYYTLAVCPVQH